jgi:hypothetical protein
MDELTRLIRLAFAKQCPVHQHFPPMKLKSLLALSVSLAAAYLTTGCASYRITPTAASITTPKAQAPIPATIGINQVEQKLQGGFPDMVRSVKQSLDESQLFKEVYYPMPATDLTDGQINLRLSSSFQMDGALFPKSFFTGFFFFLPAPIVTYTHHYVAECRLELFRGDRLLKTYNARVQVEVEKQSVDATVKLLGSDLVTQMISDRAALEGMLLPAPAPAKTF